MENSISEDEVRYCALLRRDPVHDKKWYVAVLTTMVFCRSICPARKPLKQNCKFYLSIDECLNAGFRPCKRCNPTQSRPEQSDIVNRLSAQLRARPNLRWTEKEIAALGYDISTVRRHFQQKFGKTFLQIARTERLRGSLTAITSGMRVIDAQFDVEFESASGFRAAFKRQFGAAPMTAKNKLPFEPNAPDPERKANRKTNNDSSRSRK